MLALQHWLSRGTMVPGVLFMVALSGIVFIRVWFHPLNDEVPRIRKIVTSGQLLAMLLIVFGQYFYIFGDAEQVERIQDYFLPFLKEEHHWKLQDGGFGRSRTIRYRPAHEDPFNLCQFWIGTVPVLITICLMWLTWPDRVTHRWIGKNEREAIKNAGAGI